MREGRTRAISENRSPSDVLSPFLSMLPVERAEAAALMAMSTARVPSSCAAPVNNTSLLLFEALEKACGRIPARPYI